MSTTIHIVATNHKDQHGTTRWFWDNEEASRVYADTVAEVGDTTEVYQYRLDVQDAIDEFIADSIEHGEAEKVNESYPEKQDTDDEARGTLESMLSSALSTLELDTKRLGDYEEDFSRDPQEDTDAMIRRTEKKIANGHLRIKALQHALTKF